MLNCKINGKNITINENTSIIEAFQKAGEEIAHYCYHPGLSIAGVCRLCMVHIEGQSRLQIACNTKVQEGMVISNQTEEVKKTVRWGLDFHLINHPLDCPICDQAGECELQIQYMKFGSYDPEMAERKVKKKKVVNLGSKIVLDTERCILCSRCVRFTDEVTKTSELGIFHRGDKSEIGTFHNKPLENNYAVNTVDICPVGALTAKDFRFRQRVWFLEDKPTICAGCSTGCSVKASYNEEGLFRLKPNYNEKVNGYWMCDEGRKTYKTADFKQRLRKGKKGYKSHFEILTSEKILKDAFSKIKDRVEQRPEDLALVLSCSYTNEEYEAILSLFYKTWKVKNLFFWNHKDFLREEFDGLLMRNDRSPNTRGLFKECEKQKIHPQSLKDFEKRGFQTAVVMGPENIEVVSDFEQQAKRLSGCPELIWFTACKHPFLDQVEGSIWQIPLKVHFEKSGTFTNFNGLEQSFKKICDIVPHSFDLLQIAQFFETGVLEPKRFQEQERKINYFVKERGSL